LSDESQNEIINRSDDFAGISHGHAGGIFLEGEIAAKV